MASKTTTESDEMDLLNTPEFTAHVKDLLQRHHVPGLAIATVRNGTVTSAGYGWASLDPPRECTADTLFDIASASKSLTAASVGLLVEDEKYPQVQWEAAMSSLLPGDFVMPTQEQTDGVTVDDVLSHRTGMPSHDNSYMGQRAKEPDTPRSVTRNLRNLQPAAPIRSKYMYCNMMYTVATDLVEEISGLEFPDFLDEHFFKPLAMDSSNVQPSRARARGLGDRIAPGYFWDKESGEYKGWENPSTPEAQGAGSVITSVNDYIKYVKAMMDREAPFTEGLYKGLIRSRSFQDPEYRHQSPHTSPTLYAAGWELRWYRGRLIVSHDGMISGFGTTHFFLPEFKFGAVIFGNASSAWEVAFVLAQELIDEVLEVPKDQREDWNKVEEELGGGEFDDDDLETVQKRLCPGIKEPEPLETPLGAYTGDYWNLGYHGMKVEIKEGRLFIDAKDRSMGFELSFSHVCNQTKFVAHLADEFTGGDIPFRAEFELSGGKAVRMGLHLEAGIEEYIWFDRLD